MRHRLTIQCYNPHPFSIQRGRDVCGDETLSMKSLHLEEDWLEFELHNRLAVKVTLGGKTVLIPHLHNLIAELCRLQEIQSQLKES